MKDKRFSEKKTILLAIMVAVACIMSGGVSVGAQEEYPSHPPRIASSALFPCSACHAGMETDRRKRELSFHTEIRIERHGEPQRWCLECHGAGNRDKLALFSGEEVDFKESYRLCAQCHGNIFRDWKAGVHGKRTGYWNGTKRYLLCTHCHNPHSPRFAPLQSEPAPLRPEMTLRR